MLNIKNDNKKLNYAGNFGTFSKEGEIIKYSQNKGDYMEYITENALILIPVLYVIGMFLKALEFIKDKYIPCILLAIGIAFSIALIGFNVNAVIQGVLVTNL